jgi:hypothetical protein
MKLNPRQRAKVNAALCLIHDNGYDAKPIIRNATELMKSVDARTAYELALNDFLRAEPAMLPSIAKAHNLINASDGATIDKYDAALSDYVSTGENHALKALAPMIAEDVLALAVKDGDITQDEANRGDLAKALGFEPGAALVEALGDHNEPSDQAQEQPAYSLKVEADVPQLGEAPAINSPVNGSQVGAASAPTGMIAAGAAKNWARNTAAPLPNGAVEAPMI